MNLNRPINTKSMLKKERISEKASFLENKLRKGLQ